MSLPPYLASEASSHLIRDVPEAKDLFAADEVTLTGEQMERLCQATWLVGYGTCLGDIPPAPGLKMPPLAQWIWDNIMEEDQK